MTTKLMRRVAPTSIFAVAALALVVAGCGSSSNDNNNASSGSGYGGTSKPASTPASSGGPTVALASTKLGKILVDSQGRTLYLWEADKTDKSTCNGACAGAWPPLTTTAQPTAGAGISAKMLGTSMRADGKTEVTYNGHPLYTFTGDSAAGQTNGQDSKAFGADWYVLSANGNKVEGDSGS